MAEQQNAAAPREGEQTKRQQVGGGMGGVIMTFFGTPVLPGTFKTYRKMRGNPTIALARVAGTAPVRSAQWGVEARKDAPEEWTVEVREQLEPMWPVLVKDMLFGLDYGFAAFEKVWEARDGAWRLAKVKPLLADITEIMVDRRTGAFMGLKQDNVLLDANKSFVFTHDMEAGDFYGRSRHENCRPEWSQWNSLLKKSEQYIGKAVGVIPMIEYPEGRSKDASGAEIDNFLHAKRMLSQLGQGHGVYMPNTLAKYADDLIRQGVDISQLKAWQIDFLETKVAHGAEIVEMMRHLESLMARGWLVPERTFTEGQHGTLAEAEAQGQLAMVVANLVLLDIVRHVNWYLVDPFLAVNHGEDARGAVWIEPEQLGADEKQYFRELIKAVLTNPMNVDLFMSMLNLDTLLDVAGLPKGEGAEIAEAAEVIASRLRRGDLPASANAALAGIYDAILSGRLLGAKKE